MRGIAIGASAGGLEAVGRVLEALPADFPAVVIVVQHIAPHANDTLARRFQRHCQLPVREAEDKEPLLPGIVFIAPADFHLMVEPELRFSLSREERVNYSRPSIDVLMETAAEAFCSDLTGVILTGASVDGAAGLVAIKRLGGRTIVQSPETAEVDIMPRAAIAACAVDAVLELAEIGPFLARLGFEDPC
jgi:two-component system, chemotaxis family, protein-glutamate methylesterase/glutaminase